MAKMPKTAIIVGAGLGGMATAIRLAHHGWKVQVIEKNSHVGGKLDCYTEQGFSWDIGPSRLTMPFALYELFEYVGHDVEHYLELIPVDPMGRYFYPDGKTINTWTNFHHFKIEVARYEKDHGESLENFIYYARGIYHLLAEASLFHSPKNARRYTAQNIFKNLHHLPKLLTAQTMAGAIKRYFKDPHIQQIFMHDAMIHGSSPYQAPALFNIISYLEIQGGCWYVRGGIYRLAQALERCARDLHVEFLMDTEVSEIVLEDQKKMFRKPHVTGVMTNRGSRLDTQAMICSADAIYTWKHLLKTKRQQAVIRSLERKPLSSAPFMILWGIKRRYHQLAHHNVFFSANPIEESNDIFQRKSPPTEPTVYVCVSARSDPSQAPSGQDNYFVLSHMPSLEPNVSWEEKRSTYRNLILDRLEKMGLGSLRHEIICEKVITPSDFATHTHAYHGSTCGHATHSSWWTWNRTPPRSSKINGLYFVGSSTQLGWGIPLALFSARQTAQALLNDMR